MKQSRVRGTSDQPTDLNSVIDPGSGWYIHSALDINDRGQILCLGARENARQAESGGWPGHFLLLTPL
jgi:hypothetical protein